jgi:hypothetical protein
MAEQPSVSRVRVASAPPLPQVAGADQSHFTALFRKHVSMAPQVYRNTTRRSVWQVVAVSGRQRAAGWWEVCPARAHVLRTIPIWVARMSQTARVPGSIFSFIHTLWDTPHVGSPCATLSRQAPQVGSPSAKSGRCLAGRDHVEKQRQQFHAAERSAAWQTLRSAAAQGMAMLSQCWAAFRSDRPPSSRTTCPLYRHCVRIRLVSHPRMSHDNPLKIHI